MLYHHRNFEMGVSKSFEMCLEDGSLCGLISCNISCHILRTRKDTVCAGTIQPKNDLGGNFWPPWPTLPLLTLLVASLSILPSSLLIYQDTQRQHTRHQDTQHQHTRHQHARCQHTKLMAGHVWVSYRYWNTNFTAPSTPTTHLCTRTPHPQHIYARVHHTHTQATIVWVPSGLCYWCW